MLIFFMKISFFLNYGREKNACNLLSHKLHNFNILACIVTVFFCECIVFPKIRMIKYTQFGHLHSIIFIIMNISNVITRITNFKIKFNH